MNNDPRAITVAGTDIYDDEHLLAVPLLANDEVKGLMAVWRAGKGLEFTKFELEFLNTDSSLLDLTKRVHEFQMVSHDDVFGVSKIPLTLSMTSF